MVECSRVEEKEGGHMFDGNNWFIKGSLTLIPDKGKAIAWSAYARKSESYPGIVYFSLILSDAHISIEKGISGHSTQPIHLEVHNYYEHNYLYPAMSVKNRKPRFYLEREKEKWWERLWGKLVLHTEIPYDNPPYTVSSKTYPVEFPTYQILENKHGKNPLWPVVEELIERENEAEDLGIPEGEIEAFIEQIIEQIFSFNEEGESDGIFFISPKAMIYNPKGIFLISPKSTVYRRKTGVKKALVREGDYGTWAVVNTGIREGTRLSVYDSLGEGGHKVRSRIYRIKIKDGVLFGAMRKVSDWTRIWNLAFVPNGVRLDLDYDEKIQNPVLVIER
jgi:hypothetical protein